jgi:type IV secretory pathway component VirB8
VPVPPPEYIPFDVATQRAAEAVRAQDAPRTLFTEATRQSLLAEFIRRCEGYMPQTWRTLDYMDCMVMAAPDEQRRRADEIGPKGPHYPVALFGDKGWAMPTSFQAFVPRGIGPYDTYAYDVRYERTEAPERGERKLVRYTAKVEFQLRPDMKMAPATRLRNREGFQAVSFSTTKDAGQ